MKRKSGGVGATLSSIRSTPPQKGPNMNQNRSSSGLMKPIPQGSSKTPPTQSDTNAGPSTQTLFVAYGHEGAFGSSEWDVGRHSTEGPAYQSNRDAHGLRQGRTRNDPNGQMQVRTSKRRDGRRSLRANRSTNHGGTTGDPPPSVCKCWWRCWSDSLWTKSR